MVDKYMSLTDFEDDNDIILDDTNYPKNALVTEWIDWAEDHIDEELERDFTRQPYTDELEMKKATATFRVKNPPINSITSVSKNTQRDEFETPVWEAVEAHRIIKSRDGIFKVKPFQEWRAGKAIRVVYDGGYDTIPQKVKDLAKLLAKYKYISNNAHNRAIDNAKSIRVDVISIRNGDSRSEEAQLEALEKQINELFSQLGRGSYKGVYQMRYQR